MNDTDLLYARLSDKRAECLRTYAATFTSFLDLPSCALAASFAKREHTDMVLYGGYPDAERKLCVFLPDYAATVEDCFAPDDLPLCVFRATAKDPDKMLSHRDYLGSLMALGIKRETVGDILVYEGGADLIVLSSVAGFLIQQYNTVGRTPIRSEIVPISELRIPDVRTEEIRDTVASPRLDNMISAAFRLSRSAAGEAISAGIVFVNDEPITKPDASVAEGSKLVLRGKGKVTVKSFAGESRSGRLVVLFTKYL
ncbi:MAG: RNA-binding protein [Ruminococcus sp.]|nr:RNA-binding protein [Candidatus Apopatosoma intestinale]